MGWNVGMPKAHWITLGDPMLEPLVNEVLATPEIAIDTETTGKDDVMKDHALYWSLSWGENRYCLPAHTLPFFTDAFRDQDKTWIFVNAKFDMHMVANLGIEFAGRIVDTCVMHALLYEERPHNLEYMEGEILGWTHKKGGFKEQVGMKKGETAGEALRRLEATNLQKLVDYASTDAYSTFRIYKELRRELERTNVWSGWDEDYPTMWDIFWKVEVPFTPVLWECERDGIRVNKPYLQSIEEPIRQDLTRLERDICKLAGRVFNPRSTDQIRDYFFKEKGYKPRTLTKGGKSGVRKAQVDDPTLEYFEDKGDPMAAMIRSYRELAKYDSDYVRGLQGRMDFRDRVHTRFNQDVARTGRLSSKDPNLQNIKKPDEDRYKIRGAFITEANHSLIVADYEQLEMRLLAAASMEPKMIDIFRRKWDIHMGNAAMVFGRKHNIGYEEIAAAKKIDKKVKAGELPESAMTDRVKLCLFLRQAAKSIGFGLNYGMKENKLARQIGVTPDEAKDLIDEYMSTYPAVSKFYEEAIERAWRTTYSFTLLGKRRVLPEIRSRNKMDRWQAERQAVNNEIQGTAANAAALAMIHIHREGLKKKYGCKMLLQVHDELVFECPDEYVAEVLPIIRERMEHPFKTDLAVPLDVSMGKGLNWMDAK